MSLAAIVQGACDARHAVRFPPTEDAIRTTYNSAMESDRINLIENTLQDLAARAGELRRYL
jgi:hypothetical protein